MGFDIVVGLVLSTVYRGICDWGFEKGKGRDFCAEIKEERRELQKDEKRLDEKTLQQGILFPFEMQHASDRIAKRKTNLMRLEMNSVRMHEDSLAALRDDEDNALSE